MPVTTHTVEQSLACLTLCENVIANEEAVLGDRGALTEGFLCLHDTKQNLKSLKLTQRRYSYTISKLLRSTEHAKFYPRFIFLK